MMKKYSVILSIIMVFAAASQAGALSYVIGGAYGDGGYTSPYAGAIVETFDDIDNLSVLITGNYTIVDGTSGTAAAPWYDDGTADGARDVTNYLSVPENLRVSPVSATIAFFDSYNYFGLWWGSMDTYNKLEFLDENGNVLDTVLGTTFSSGSGNQTIGETNKYVNFYGMQDFSAVRMTSTSYAFEIDNIAVGKDVVPVPEPTTMLLLGSGLLGLAGFRKKTK